MPTAGTELHFDAKGPSGGASGDVENGQVVAIVAAPNAELSTEVASDPNVVDWDGPDDPEKPMNWSKTRKGGIIFAVGLMRFVTPLASSMMASALTEIQDEFKSSSSLLITFTVSIYASAAQGIEGSHSLTSSQIIGFGLGPLVLAPLSEIYGRNMIFHAGNIIFTIFTAACGLSPTAGALFGFRLLAGIVGGAPLTNGGGTIADIVPLHRRGLIMTIFTLSMLVGPVLGPTIGGFLAQAKGWRWIFWFLTILSGANTILSFVFLRETYSTVLLERKAAHLRKETGNPLLRAKGKSTLPLRRLLIRAIQRPTRMLVRSPVILGVSLYMAMVYGVIYLLFVTFSTVFQQQYGFSVGIAGLSYLGIGIGMVFALFTMGKYNDSLVMRLSEKHGKPKPEYRLILLLPGIFAIPVGLLLYGWTAQYRVHWIVPIIATSFVGIGTTGSFVTIQTYLVDGFTEYAASALAANSLIRSIAGGLLPLAGPAMYSSIGLGWGNSLLALVSLLSGGFIVAIYIRGEEWRENYEVNFE